MEGGASCAGSGEVIPALEWFPAPAKLNLFLHVLGRRADGMHLLQTVFRLIGLEDRVGLAATGDGAIRRLTPLANVPEEIDLCVRAARLLKQATGAKAGAVIALEKRIPMGGGLGGGSSDAATVLIALNRLWNTGLSRETLMQLGEQLGADVPLFVHGESALGEGIGERLRPLALAPAWYLVLVPQVAVSTKEIFSDAALTRDTEALKIPPFLPGQGRNDLEPVATRRFPEIAAHLDWLRERRPEARMTGSGACVFAALATEAEARDLLARLPERMHGFVAQGLDSHPLRHLA
jgi:4-diphosphocytidyl-2-C-methyl-D-erythritol kinase